MSSSDSSSSSDSDTSGTDVGDMEVIRLPRVFKPRLNFHEPLSEFAFKEKFRVSQPVVEFLVQRIGMHLQRVTMRNHALQPVEQILCVLHWLGCGAQYHVAADTHGLSKATVHRCVKHVCSLIVEYLLQEEVAWPTENIQAVPQMFMRAANFPRVAGVVDGSLIQIDAPYENEAAFVDRQSNHSINTMVVCGPNLEFFYASARWPGSVHDARVLRCSTLSREWDNGWRPFPNALLLGDSGYGLKPWLLTPCIPVQIPRTDGVRRYLRAFKSTRRLVENSLGILKEKFPCLNHLRLQPVAACNVILACITLHNIEKKIGSEVYVPYEAYNNDDDDEPEVHEEPEVDPAAIQVLRNMIDLFEV